MSNDWDSSLVSKRELETILDFVDRQLRSDIDRSKVSQQAAAFREAFDVLGRPLVHVGQDWWCYNAKTGCFQQLSRSDLERIVIRSPIGLRDKIHTFARSVVSTLEILCDKGPGWFADRPNAIAVFNGVLILETEANSDRRVIRFVEVFSPEYRCTGRIPAVYDPNADTFDIEGFLDESIGDAATAEFLLSLVGLALVGDGTRTQQVLLFHGTGANGKGVLCQLISALFPCGTRTAVPPAALNNDYGRAQLLNSRLNIVAELDRLGRDDLTQLKAIVTGEPIQARRVGGNGFTFHPRALHIIATNTLPQFGARTAALERRFVVIPFNKTIPPERRDPFLADKLKGFVLPGLLRLCVEAANRLYARLDIGEQPIVLSDSARTATENLFGEDQSVCLFVVACLDRTGDSRRNRISASAMYDAYSTHCDAAGAIALSQAQFRRNMETLGFRQVHSNGHYWTGVRWPKRMEGLEGG